MQYILEQGDQTLATHSGLALIGRLLERTSLSKRLNEVNLTRVEPEISNGDVAFSYLGLLVQGRGDFDHIEPFREDPFFKQSLGIHKVPSSPTLRQRMDMAGQRWVPIVGQETIRLLKDLAVTPSPVLRDLVPLDVDVCPFDNSDTHKEGVSLTYKQVEGYAPIFAYLGQEGYAICGQLRPGNTHCQLDTDIFLRQAIVNAKQITSQPLLVRLDAGNDSLDNIKVCIGESVHYIIKRNLRHESVEQWLSIAREHGDCEEERPGKWVYTGSIYRDRELEHPLRIVFRVVHREISSTGQMLLVPEVEVETYWTSLSDPAATVIELYHAHGTSEQFHSELKTELDLERLPSGRFATNSLVLQFGLLAYNLLRFIGQESLKQNDAPVRRQRTRRRIRTVIQGLITLASRVVYHARRWRLVFGVHSPWFPVFCRIYMALSP